MQMPVQYVPAPLLALIVLTAAGYAVATVGMKVAAQGVLGSGGLLVLTGFVLVLVTETVLLRHWHLPVVYIAIIGVPPDQRQAFYDAVEMPELADDPRFQPLLYTAEDSYAAQRQWYLQNRRFKLSKEIDESELENPYE